jgi:Fe-S-cluster containining protein
MRSAASETRPNREAGLPALVARCQADAAMLAGLEHIYDEVDRAVAALSAEPATAGGLVCLGGGSCCKFDLFDHRLYLTVAELALLVSRPPAAPDRARRGRCPYQLGGRCAAYPRRPLGCRTFFCRSPQKTFLQELHQRFHGSIARLHQSHCIPYAYGELTGLVVQLIIDK